jgi:hypothetical protein
MNAQGGKILFNGHLASVMLKALRKLNHCCSVALPNLTQNDVVILFYIFEVVWRKQTSAFLNKYAKSITKDGID